MEEQIERMDAIAEDHAVVDGSGGQRKISLEPERIEDGDFVRICSAGGDRELGSVLEPLLERFRGDDLVERGEVLREVIEEVLARVDDFGTLERYIWLLQFSCGLCLLRDLPVGLSFEINKVIRSVANLDTEEYQFDPLMIHTIAKSLFEDIPLKGMNLVHVIKKLAVLNQKLFSYVSIAMIFAGVRHYTRPDQPTRMYRLYGLSEVLDLLESLKSDHLQQKSLDIQRIFLILKLLSCYQNVAILRYSQDSRPDIEEQHRCFGEFFIFREEHKRSYLRHLALALEVVKRMSGRADHFDRLADNEDFMLVVELLELDMIPLVKDDLGEEE
ncbi:uncharacterized protein LOC120415040 [Culex pipiens pallens]|uniref:uncharacterized protein LOC120415040 n=1 Tax=Culex pipiens pallens TaxID=42434 RepID=UPI00195387CA|nr:uncharacterized protein LOC120415040 [Culex pipiens pallens]